MHFDETQHYYRKDFHSQDFTDNWSDKEDNEFFANPTDIVKVSEPMLKYTTIYRERSNFKESHNLSPF